MTIRRFSGNTRQRLGVFINLLLVFSLLFSSVSLAAPVSASSYSSLSTDETSTVTPTVTPESAPLLSLSKSVAPAIAPPGEVVTFTLVVSNAGTVSAQDLLLSDPLPQGFNYVEGSAPEADYDPSAKLLTWELPSLEAGQEMVLSFEARVTGPPGEERVNAATLTGPDATLPLTATATMYVDTPGQGSTVYSPDGRVELQLPPGAVGHNVEVSIQPLPSLELPPDHHLFYRFELTAYQDGHPDHLVTIFHHPVTATVSYSDTEVAGLLEDLVHLVYWDEELGTWVPVPTTLDEEANRVVVYLSLLGQYALMSEDEVYFQPRLEAGQVSLFTGDSSFSYDLEVPAGAGGLKVPLTLRYDSSIPNGMKCSECESHNDDNSDGGWVGVGWTLELGRMDEGPHLTLNGISSDLDEGELLSSEYTSMPDPVEDYYVYYGDRKVKRHRLRDEKFLKIVRDIFDGKTSTEVHSITGLGHWDVWDKSGTQYIFGGAPYDSDSKTGSRLSTIPGTAGYERKFKTWKLNEIIDTHGNRVEIAYKVHTTTEGGERTNFKESYPAVISYTTNYSTTVVDDHPEYKITFEVTEKGFDIHADKKLAETGFILRAVTVWYSPQKGVDYEPGRRYEFVYEDIDAPDHYWLKSITQYGSDWFPGCSSEENCKPLPPTTFDYTPKTIQWRISGPNWRELHEVDRPFLTKVTNGYEGRVDFDYEAWECYDYTAGDQRICVEEPQEEPENFVWLQRQHVKRKTLSSDDGLVTPIVVEYQHANPDAKWSKYPPSTCRHDDRDPCFEQFIGFGQVVENWKEGNETTKQVRTEFHDTEGYPKDRLKGKITSTWIGDDDVGSDFIRTEYEYTIKDYGWPGGEEGRAKFVYTSEVIGTTCSGGECPSKMTRYFYETWMQDDGQYGNLTEILEYAGTTDNTLYRSTEYFYHPNTEAWIVDRVAAEGVWKEHWNWEGAAQTWYYYDDQDDHHDFPTKGNVTRVQRLFDPEWTNGAPEELPVTWQTSDVTYGYDPYGNVTSETVYKDYGEVYQDANWNPVPDFPTDGRTATMVYDDDPDLGHHIFPLEVTNPLDHTAITEYYGVNSVPLDIDNGGFPGVVKSVTDSDNEITTTYQYDAFGRVTKEIRPGDDENLPTTEHKYYDHASPPSRATYRREVSGNQLSTLDSWVFYDGLGRLIQSQAESDDAGEIILANRTYDALGRVENEYVPYEVEATGGDYQIPDLTRPRTSYTYDALGRTTVVTSTDGTTMTTAYRGWEVAVLDAKGSQKIHRNDAFGRLVSVREYLEEELSDPDFDLDPYTITAYAYDEWDNLVAVYDANAHDSSGNLLPDPPYVTTMEYNELNRKTAMHDPDMGGWAYEYDALGNLETQIDAKGQVIGFEYDELNRLVFKDLPTGTDVHYYYDEGGYGRSVGKRTRMTDGSGSTAYYYEDDRGRLSREERWIDGAPTDLFTTRYEYDSMDRVEKTIYPDGENLVPVYNRQGLPSALWEVRLDAVHTVYASGARYNALGQLNYVEFSWGQIPTNYTYDDEESDPDTPSFRLMEIETVGGSGQTVLQLQYTYDDVGNVKTITDGTNVDQVQTFEYDALDRLFHASTDANGQGLYDRWYGNGKTGNRLFVNDNEYSYDGSGHSNPQPHAVTSTSDGDSFVYDANGNMTTRFEKGVSYRQAWDPENRLTSVVNETANETTTFVYDGAGALVKKTWDAEGQTVTTFYVGSHFEVQVEGEFTPGPTPTPTNTPTPGPTPTHTPTPFPAPTNTSTPTPTPTEPPTLPPPTNLQVCIDEDGNSLYWSEAPGTSTYRVYRAAFAPVPVDPEYFIGQGNGPHYRDSSGQWGHYYVVTAFHAEGESSPTDTVQATQPCWMRTAEGDVTITKYYFFGGQRIAMRTVGEGVEDVVSYLMGDHLGSTSVVLDANGEQEGPTLRYYPYGGVRSPGDPSTFPTDYRFTGQRNDGYIKLYQMGARWYDYELGRWISPDTIIPDPANPQGFNRYSYVNNRPLVAIDPTGHDLLIVGGAGGNVDIADEQEIWKQWIMEYKGWSEEDWEAFVLEWKNAGDWGTAEGFAARNDVLAQHGIGVFAWGGSTKDEAKHNAAWGHVGDMLDELAEQISDMDDVILIGYSKGGNLALHYMNQAAKGELDGATMPVAAILLGPATHPGGAIIHRYRFMEREQVPQNVRAVSICATGDPACSTIRNAANYTPPREAGHSTHGPYAHKVIYGLNLAMLYEANSWLPSGVQ